MLIIEGPDLVGKTTLCNELLKRLTSEEGARTYGQWPAIYGHFSRLPAGWNYFKSYLPYITRYTVMDRFHVSELVYGGVTRGKTHISPGGLRLLEALLTLAGSYTVLVTASDAFIERRFADKKRDEMFKLEQILAVNARYKLLADYHPEAVIDLTYEVSEDGAFPAEDDALIDTILRGWTNRLAQVHAHMNGGSYYEPANIQVGSLHPVCR